MYDDVFRVPEQTAANAAQTASILKRLGARDIVDAACGTGADTLLLWGTGDLDLLVANDLNDAMLGRMRERLHHSGTPFTEGWSRDSKGLAVTQVEWTCLDQHLPPERFDAVLCTGIGFYHLLTTERFVAALRSWAKLLRPGGHIVVDTPARGDAIRAMREGAYTPTSTPWATTEVTGPSGRRYLAADRGTVVRLAGSPLGWRQWSTWIVAELDSNGAAHNLRSLSTGGAYLDREGIADLGAAVGLEQADLSGSTQTAVVDVPASTKNVCNDVVLLRKP